MRVISGSAKGRKLKSVPGPGTRPITARAKGALFSILGQDIRGAAFLDLFAGTGSVGIEALSRGAGRVVFIERGRNAIRTVRDNLELTRLGEYAEVVQGDAFQYLAHAPADRPFDYVYVAPPQYRALWAKALLRLDASSLLTPEGLVIVQIHPKEVDDVTLSILELIEERNYGSVLLRFYAKSESSMESEATPEGDVDPC